MPETERPELEVAGGLATMMGVVMISSAMLDHWVDGIVSCVFDRVDGAKQIRPQRPSTRKDEAEFLRHSFDKLAPLRPYRDEAIELLGKLKPVAQFRHIIANGRLRNPDFRVGVLEFSRAAQGDDRKRFTVTEEDLARHGEEIKALIGPFMKLTHRLAEEFDPDYVSIPKTLH